MRVLTLEGKSSKQTVLELGSIFIGAFIYFFCMMMIVRQYILIEGALCLLLPIVVHLFNQRTGRAINYRILQLIVIESVFMLFVILSKLVLRFKYPHLNTVIGYGFRSLFLIQFSFFILYQYKVKSYFGLIRTVMFLFLLIPWFSEAPLQGAIDMDGRFLFSGVEAPHYIIAYYCFWVIGVPLVDSKTLPNFLTASLHFSSVLVALYSKEFFHVRLLTASHLFVLDYLFSYSTPYDRSFGVLNRHDFLRYEKYIKPIIDKLTLIGCLYIVLITYSKGINL